MHILVARVHWEAVVSQVPNNHKEEHFKSPTPDSQPMPAVLGVRIWATHQQIQAVSLACILPRNNILKMKIIVTYISSLKVRIFEYFEVKV